MTKNEFKAAFAPLTECCVEEVDEKLAACYYAALEDLPAEALQAAVMRHLCESETRWLPSIGRLRQYAAEAMHGREMTWAEAWDKITSLIDLRYKARHCPKQLDAYRAAKSKLPETVFRFIDSYGGLADLAESDTGVAMSHFRDFWKCRTEDQRRQRVLPEQLRPRIAGTSGGARLGEILPQLTAQIAEPVA